MIKHQAPAFFEFHGTETCFETENVELAKMMLRHVASTAHNIDVYAPRMDREEIIFAETFVNSSDAKLLLKVVKFIKENTGDPIDYEIGRLEDIIKGKKA